MNTNDFLQTIKKKCEAKNKEMAALELSVWDTNHEKELKEIFGFNDAKLKARKKDLQIRSL